ncbi:protein of unknown function [Micropruina glycogenica]|uniref:Uncharacterized protein n=1 Tax=Micropruina glycogenica TaxID=75385 RepID=A0A2N9JDZ9_9ACTN|nr:protein of unknown function [Micropruina glycogenica]
MPSLTANLTNTVSLVGIKGVSPSTAMDERRTLRHCSARERVQSRGTQCRRSVRARQACLAATARRLRTAHRTA